MVLDDVRGTVSVDSVRGTVLIITQGDGSSVLTGTQGDGSAVLSKLEWEFEKDAIRKLALQTASFLYRVIASGDRPQRMRNQCSLRFSKLPALIIR